MIDAALAIKWYEILRNWRKVAVQMTPPTRRMPYQADAVSAAVRQYRRDHDGRIKEG